MTEIGEDEARSMLKGRPGSTPSSPGGNGSRGLIEHKNPESQKSYEVLREKGVTD